MKLLLIEDDKQYVETIVSQLSTLRGHLDCRLAASRASAEEAISTDFYDLIILDLKIPTVDGELDAEPEHGYATFEHARMYAPGTPLFVLTGSAAEPFIDRLQKNINQVDIWGTGSLQSVTFLQKHKFGSSFLDMIRPYFSGYSAIEDVELEKIIGELTAKDSRIIKIFTNRKGAVKCQVSLLSGGLSGAKVVRLKLTDTSGAPVLDAVAKLGPKANVFDESERFESHVNRLTGGATPRKLGLVEYGAGDLYGVFYSLAAGYDTNAFEIASQNSAVSEAVVTKISELTRPWRDGLPQLRQTVQEIRNHGVNDEIFYGLRTEIPFPWVEDFEKRNIQTKYGCCHGDLHGFNVLASNDGSPILIDYGDVGNAALAWDAITLELSLMFHPQGPLRDSPWPTEYQAKNWGDLEIYLKDCPTENFVRACRAWAFECSAGQREIAACAYGYLVRQLKYDNDRAKIFSLLEGVKAVFDNA